VFVVRRLTIRHGKATTGVPVFNHSGHSRRLGLSVPAQSENKTKQKDRRRSEKKAMSDKRRASELSVRSQGSGFAFKQCVLWVVVEVVQVVSAVAVVAVAVAV